jgi:hypothetical protein
MTTVFLKSGSVYRPASEDDLDMHPTLPPCNFIIIKHPATGALMLSQVEPFGEPPKLYGNIMARAERILKTYFDRPNSTGVLLSGEKGSGKTQLARLVGTVGAGCGMPCIIINAAWVGDEFFKLIQSIEQPCIVLFDEFEKVYDRDEQKQVLTLLDGVFPSKKLFILTCNDKWLISDHMRNRPGRIYYLIDYKGIPEDFIVEYCTDNLEAKQHIPAIVRVSKMFNEFNFDMLKAMVEEMNRYNETPEQVLEMLNARPTTDSEGTYTITLNIDGKDVKSGYYPTETEGSPLQGPELVISYNVDDEDDEDGAVSEALESLASAPRTKRRNRRAGRHLFNVRQTCLHKFNAERGEFEYKLPDDVFVRFQRVRKSEAKYFDLLA